MAMGRRKKHRQRNLYIEADQLSKGPSHPFYQRLNQVLDEEGFDEYVEAICERFYADGQGRPSLPPAGYFRLLLVGYFEGIDAERGIAWRVSDSLSLREFLGYELTESPPDHSTISRNRRRLDLEVHQEVFTWVLTVLAKRGQVSAKSVGVDATSLGANAALRSIVRRDTEEGYQEFLDGLAKASGIETPTRQDRTRIDRNRPKKGSNQEWKHPEDPDARITKMKDGRTHLAHKAEHAVDLDTGAVIGVTLQPADRGDTQSFEETVQATMDNLSDVLSDEEAARQLSDSVLSEIVADKGYHSNDVLVGPRRLGIRTYIPEPQRGRRRWKGKSEAKAATYANRRRVRGARGLQLWRRHRERTERSFAHCYETGGLRRLHLRGRENIHKRQLLHVAGFNLGLVMRSLVGTGTPRGLQGRLGRLRRRIRALLHLLERLLRHLEPPRHLSSLHQPTGEVWGAAA